MYNEFRNLNELYKRIKPALYSKVEEIRKYQINYVKEEDIWNYLSTHVWNKKKNLMISDMIIDIFDLDNNIIQSYVLSILEKEKRDIRKDEGDVL